MSEKVAVLLGGNSAEREISLLSGHAIVAGLQESGIAAQAIDTRHHSILDLKAQGYSKAFIALHGRGGEDGSIQGVLEFLQMPYTGSGVMASALAMDKLRTKLIWSASGFPVPPWVSLNKQQFAMHTQREMQKILQLDFPLVVKPTCEGSSVGVSRVSSLEELPQALEKAFCHDHQILVEKYLAGPEYTVAILGDQVLPIIRIQPKNIFYDYDAKYLSEQTEYFCPSGLNSTEEQQLATLAKQAYDVLGCSGWGRVDVMHDNGIFYLLEVNTVPGMTSHSLVPIAAKAYGLSFPQLVSHILSATNIYQGRQSMFVQVA